jgi:trimethylamine--corrinoid protein Co-methyltransferase
MPWALPSNPDAPTEPLDEDAVQAVHNGAMRVLEEIGIEFIHDEAKEILGKAGCTVNPDGDNVRMDRDFVMEQVRKAPSEFHITPRNPARQISIGGDRMLFAIACCSAM